MLPKFMLAENNQERIGYLYVVHNEEPRFVLEGDEEDFESDCTLYWIDEPKLTEEQIDELVSEAIDFMYDEYDAQESIYRDQESDEEEDEEEDEEFDDEEELEEEDESERCINIKYVYPSK